jgi:hypothetical protein
MVRSACDDKKNARPIVSGVILETLRSLGLDFPQVDAKHRSELQKIRGPLSK